MRFYVVFRSEQLHIPDLHTKTACPVSPTLSPMAKLNSEAEVSDARKRMSCCWLL